jgi:hypothetical protein
LTNNARTAAIVQHIKFAGAVSKVLRASPPGASYALAPIDDGHIQQLPRIGAGETLRLEVIL